MRGTFGHINGVGTTSGHLRDATEQRRWDCCTPCLDPPRVSVGRGRTPVVDDVIFKKVCEAVEIFDADGASDEQRTGRLLSEAYRGREPVFRNLKCQLTDTRHASRMHRAR